VLALDYDQVRTRGGILPKGNAASKRKLNEVMLRVSHGFHSFSTRRFSCCFPRNFVSAPSFGHFSKQKQALFMAGRDFHSLRIPVSTVQNSVAPRVSGR